MLLPWIDTLHGNDEDDKGKVLLVGRLASGESLLLWMLAFQSSGGV
jgi:hypothetical protein